MPENSLPDVPYAHMLQGRDAAEVMRTTLPRFEALLANFTAEQIEAVPGPGKWSLREEVCHLADCEVAWAWRLRHVYGEDNPVLQSFEQDAWARAYSGSGYTFIAAWATWRAMRAWNIAFTDALTAEDKQRPAVHTSAGAITLWTLVEIAAGHDLHHLAALEARTSRSR